MLNASCPWARKRGISPYKAQSRHNLALKDVTRVKHFSYCDKGMGRRGGGQGLVVNLLEKGAAHVGSELSNKILIFFK